MLTQDRVKTIFADMMKPYPLLGLSFVDPDKYIADALDNDFVQVQIRMGVYDEQNIYTDFLGVASSHQFGPGMGLIRVCLPLILSHTEGLSDELAEAYVKNIAAHEVHHFETGHRPPNSTTLEQAHREMECERLIDERYPELAPLMAKVNEQSPVISRVMERVAAISRSRGVR